MDLDIVGESIIKVYKMMVTGSKEFLHPPVKLRSIDPLVTFRKGHVKRQDTSPHQTVRRDEKTSSSNHKEI